MTKATGSPHYERLSPQDASFLAFESPTVYMHVGAIAVFEQASFALPSGDVDVPKFRRYVESRLDVVGRTRQRLANIPVFRQPVWIDDDQFDIARHVFEVRLPEPGGEAELKGAASQIFSSSLNRSRPLWEMHVVQGLADRSQFAVIARAHHAMLDGIAGVEFARIMLSQEPAGDLDELLPTPVRTAPSSWRLVRDEALRYAGSPLALARGLASVARDGNTRRSLFEHARVLVAFMASGLRGTPRGPLMGTASNTRTIDWFTCDRADERSIRARLGGTRDDVTLTTAAGAARSLIQQAGGDTHSRVRAMAPVNLRLRSDENRLGNRVSMLIVELPVDEPGAIDRLERVRERTAALIEDKHQLAVDTLAMIDRWTGTLAQSVAMWLSRRVRAYNLVVTNIPGPPVPLYALQSKLLAFYPVAPVFPDQHFNIAALAHLGKVYWGVNYAGGDVTEQRRFVEDLQASFAELVTAAADAPPRVKLVGPPATARDANLPRRAHS